MPYRTANGAGQAHETEGSAQFTLIHLDDYGLWQTARLLWRLTIAERSRVLTQFHAETGLQPAQAQAVDIMRWISNPSWSRSTHCTYCSYLNA